MRIIGLDLSLTSTGISVYDENAHVLTLSVQTTSDDQIQPRIKAIYVAIEANLTKDMAKNGWVFIEAQLNSKFNTGYAFDRAELAGVVKYNLWDKKIPFSFIHPGVLKKFVVGRGNSRGEKKVSKKEMMARVKEWEGFVAKNDDEADAYALADFGYHLFNPDKPRRTLLPFELWALQEYKENNGWDD
jgi:Holliday junction resolvasome RuvABC endonuclease subunit